jgi:hypothetical protein
VPLALQLLVPVPMHGLSERVAVAAVVAPVCAACEDNGSFHMIVMKIALSN